ncbi:DNA primase [Methanofollis aquaemaris]|uniref:DNA primase DnaG n=1 Tax=Methanofollis aquaemaris TaxID=126734 RepID=A0A8A3S849_9EURY|nr:DNA primase DnaG [Methanofollis aquaemaris]QSZ68305.1 DNA primase [Methanofollis aquaemaris]
MYSSDTTKYLIHINLYTEGVVEKPDVVGAIFGQTEGLLGEDLDLRDLQRTGRVGRIDVHITSKKGETRGEILISSSLDRAETAVLAASLETIDRVGPCVAHARVERIEDIRVTKRKQIVERAKELLLTHFDETTIDSTELIDDVRESMRIEKIGVLGEERVPAGPNVHESDAVIVVEGRADVINLLRYGIKNAVAVEGTKVPAVIAKLCEVKTATAFLDGDRGGDLILRELLQVADIDYVALCPRGKSVEDLTRKEIIKALRNKMPVEYFREQLDEGKEPAPEKVEIPVKEETEVIVSEGPEEEEGPAVPEVTGPTLEQQVREVEGRKTARFLNADYNLITEVGAGEVEDALETVDPDAAGIVLDRPVDQRLVDAFLAKGIEFVAAPEFREIVKRPLSLRLMKIRKA